MSWTKLILETHVTVVHMETSITCVFTLFSCYLKTGEKGQPGPIGRKGDQGPIGLEGQKGEIGAFGAQGDKGITGDVGDTGPQGPKGMKGDPGPRGIKGQTGLPGLQVNDNCFCVSNQLLCVFIFGLLLDTLFISLSLC